MTTPQSSTPYPHDDGWEQIKRHLPRSRSDPTLLVLKGHLLIEERLERILEAKSRKPAFFVDARLSFRQKLSVVRALVGLPAGREARFIEQLNALRNKMTHHLEGFEVDTELASLLQPYHDGEGPDPRSLPLRQKLSWLRNVIALSCGFLEALATSAAVHEDRPLRS